MIFQFVVEELKDGGGMAEQDVADSCGGGTAEEQVKKKERGGENTPSQQRTLGLFSEIIKKCHVVTQSSNPA